jgi:SAM-dependent methyltransferase
MRVLRPGGRLVLGLLTRDGPWGELYLRDAAERIDSVFANASFFTEGELPALLDAPYTLLKGLYHPPDPDLDRRAAEQLEGEKQALQEDRAGFVSVRWEKEAS